MIKVFTDGSSTGKVGEGGWSAIIQIVGGKEIELSGGDVQTTNNRMELMGPIAGLKYLKEKYSEMYETEDILIVSDSQYVVKGITTWIHKWIQKNFKAAGGKQRPNKDLWIELFELVTDKTNFEWIRGHIGHEENERCDVLAKQAKQNFKDE